MLLAHNYERYSYFTRGNWFWLHRQYSNYGSLTYFYQTVENGTKLAQLLLLPYFVPQKRKKLGKEVLNLWMQLWTMLTDSKCPTLWKQKWQPTSVLLPGQSHGQRNLAGYSPWGRAESDVTEWLHFNFSLSCIGEGNGNLLQCSCLENPRDRGAWWAAVYGVTQSDTTEAI